MYIHLYIYIYKCICDDRHYLTITHNEIKAVDSLILCAEVVT